MYLPIAPDEQNSTCGDSRDQEGDCEKASPTAHEQGNECSHAIPLSEL